MFHNFVHEKSVVIMTSLLLTLTFENGKVVSRGDIGYLQHALHALMSDLVSDKFLSNAKVQHALVRQTLVSNISLSSHTLESAVVIIVITAWM